MKFPRPLVLLNILFPCLLISPTVYSSECVVLLHGLARDNGSMDKMEAALANEYAVVNHDYPSTEENIATLAKTAIPAAVKECGEAELIHFVTHSMGGILVRQYLTENKIENLGRVVMLGPPNHGSEIVDELGEMPGFELINGEPGKQLGTSSDSVPNSLGPVDCDLGVIAGEVSFNPVYSAMLPGDDDGKVSVDSTKVEGMKDHIVLPVSHTFMMRNTEVIEQTQFYLGHGRFDRLTDNE